MNTAADVLRAAKARLTPTTWIQGDSAYDADGNGCDPTDPGAVCFCAVGALESLAAGDLMHVALDFLYAAAPPFARQALGAADLDESDEDPVFVNDNTDLDTVHRMYDEAIRLAEVA